MSTETYLKHYDSRNSISKITRRNWLDSRLQQNGDFPMSSLQWIFEYQSIWSYESYQIWSPTTVSNFDFILGETEEYMNFLFLARFLKISSPFHFFQTCLPMSKLFSKFWYGGLFENSCPPNSLYLMKLQNQNYVSGKFQKKDWISA